MAATVPPSFDNLEFFNQDFPKYLEPLEPAWEFLEKHGTEPNSKPEATYLCFGDGCERTFLYYGDFCQHMSSECTSTSFSCDWCKNYQSTNYYYLRKHLCTCNQRPAGAVVLRRQIIATPFQCGCGKSFKTKTTLTKHKKNCTPTIDVVSTNQFQCGCGKSYKHKKHLTWHKKSCTHQPEAKKARIDGVVIVEL